MKRLILCLISSLFCLELNAQAANDSFDDEARWFEIEVIVYKVSHGKGLAAESWDGEVQIIRKENLVDFLQPYETISDEDIQQEFLPGQQHTLESNTSIQSGKISDQAPRPGASKQTSQNSAAKLDQNSAHDSSSDQFSELAQDLNTLEKPFVPLEPSLLQLQNEANTLRRHPEYELLFHQAWRQPVHKSTLAEHIRIAGGRDFSESYEFNGDKKIVQTELDLNISDNFGYSTTNPQESLAVKEKKAEETQASVESAKSENSTAVVSTSTTQALRPIPWVPELEGSVQIYLNRYLHVKTNLYLRRPDKDEIEVVDLNLITPEILGLSSNLDQDILSADPSKGQSTIQPSVTNQNENGILSQTNTMPDLFDHSVQNSSPLENNNLTFSWEIDDNFLETESEKMYIERLFNYPLTQSRRLKSGELHLFDHPLLGVLIMIRPYELEPSEPEVAQSL